MALMKSSERWQEIKQILHSALEKEPAERTSFLNEKCGNDPELRREVESLVAAHTEAGGRLESPALEMIAETVVNHHGDGLVGTSLGHYQIIERLGGGGMGEVYLARDTRLDRKAAIKLL